MRFDSDAVAAFTLVMHRLGLVRLGVVDHLRLFMFFHFAGKNFVLNLLAIDGSSYETHQDSIRHSVNK